MPTPARALGAGAHVPAEIRGVICRGGGAPEVRAGRDDGHEQPTAGVGSSVCRLPVRPGFRRRPANPGNAGGGLCVAGTEIGRPGPGVVPDGARPTGSRKSSREGEAGSEILAIDSSSPRHYPWRQGHRLASNLLPNSYVSARHQFDIGQDVRPPDRLYCGRAR